MTKSILTNEYLANLSFQRQGIVEELTFSYEVWQLRIFGQTLEICNEFDKFKKIRKQFFCFNDLETTIHFSKDDLQNLIIILNKMSKP